MNGCLFAVSLLGALIVGVVIGFILTLGYVTLNRERPRKSYCYKETIKRKPVKEMGDLNKIEVEKKGGVDGSRALDDFEIGGNAPCA